MLFGASYNPHKDLTHSSFLSRVLGLNETFSQRFYFYRNNTHDAGVFVALIKIIIDVLARYPSCFEAGKFLIPPDFVVAAACC